MENLLKKKLKFYSVFLCDFIDNTSYEFIKKNTENEIDFYYHLITIYYLNYLDYVNKNNNNNFKNIESTNENFIKKEKEGKLILSNKKSIYTFFENKKSNFHINYFQYLDNYEIQYIDNLQKKLYLYIVKKTHPDKTTNKKLWNIYKKVQKLHYNNDIAILFIIAVALDYKIKKLKEREKKLFEKNIFKYIIKKQIDR
mgnify:CR=1 FL=1